MLSYALPPRTDGNEENPYGYTGREIDTKDLYYYRARYYDPTTQRFLSRDPIEFEAGDFNFYRYVGGDPVNFRDPTGLLTQILVWHKGEGKDVGHTAIRVNDKVYGYYPTDTNENGIYDMSELLSSKGELHINDLTDFHDLYEGDTIEVFTLNSDKEKEKALEKYYKNLEKNPGKYNLATNQCTTTAVRGLRKADYFDLLYSTAPKALMLKLKLLYKLGITVTSVSTTTAEKL